MKRAIQYLITFALFGVSLVFLTWNEPTWHAFVALILAVACGVYATKTNFGKG